MPELSGLGRKHAWLTLAIDAVGFAPPLQPDGTKDRPAAGETLAAIARSYAVDISTIPGCSRISPGGDRYVPGDR